MSAPSTPRSTRNASPDHEATQDSPAGILTPGQKIKAMLAQFDSGSESDDADSSTKQQKQRPVISKPHIGPNKGKNVITHDTQDDDDEEEDDDEEDNVIFAPRGRMAARMHGQHDDKREPEAASPQNEESAYDRVAKRLHAPSHDSKSENANQPAAVDQSSDEDLPSAPFRKRLLNKKVTKPHSPENNDAPSPSSARSESPLFVGDKSESEPRPQNNTDEPRNARFLALVEQKRKEREEAERVEAEKKAARAEKAKQFSSDILSGEDSDSDPESARKMTQQSRPARKASKKAIEEMNKETQRMSRNMQLAHQARTKRKLTKESFLARFAVGKQQDTPPQSGGNPPTSSSSAPSSDGEVNKEKTTPPTSPIPLPFDDEAKDSTTLEQVMDKDYCFPTLEELRSEVDSLPQPVTVEQVKIHEVQTEPVHVSAKQAASHKELTKPPVRVRVSREKVAQYQKDASDDDDLDVITSPGRCRKLAAFENLPSRNAQEDKSMLKLRLLAHLTSPTRRSKSMTPAELGASLRMQARQQALQERQARIEELRAKGIVIETAEEREAMEADIEDLVEKARKEAIEIARREKAARGENPDGDDDEDDEDYYDFSGSEDEEMENAGDEDDEGDEGDVEEEDDEDEDGPENENGANKETSNLLENEANEAPESEGEQSEAASMNGDNEVRTQGDRRRRQRRIVSDDEDEETEKPQEVKTPARSIAPSMGSAQRPHFPDMPETSSFSMSLTQAFAGTLAEDQSDDEEDSFRIIKSLPDPGLADTRRFDMQSQVMVKDSQEERRQSIDLFAGYTQQSNIRVSESPAPSQFPEPTQDAGFVLSPFDQTKRFADPPTSTIDTVLISQNESPIAQRRRLQRGRPIELSDEEDDDFEIKASAFNVMKKASKRKPPVKFDKMKSDAKNHVEEAAEESEDEYAGLGGGSDDDDGGENEYDREMINDSSAEVVDAKQLAALNA
jgi:mediator of replication checkpoint protein 1